MIQTPHLRMHRLSALFALLLFTINAAAQVPTTADCLGAIPICQNQYSYSLSPSGEGNYPTEINSGSSCLGSGELNDTWYTFTVQQSGNLSFLITPNAMSDDYDWAVYNLTTNNCADIFSNPSLEVSCNFSGTAGTTGPNGNSTLNSQSAAGTPYNATIPVVAGQTYVVNISNFSSTSNGYTIDFGQSTAVIFDQVPPQLLSIAGQGCNTTTLTVTFTENILCNTVQASDFSIPGYTITNVNSSACTAGGTYDNTFTLTVSPGLPSGSYTMNMAGPVTDLCGNPLQLPASLAFNISGTTATMSTTTTLCGQQTGSATVTPSGTGPYSYTWNPNVGNTATVNNLGAGTYTVTVTDGAGCQTTATGTVTATGSSVVVTVTSQADALCNAQCNGTVTVSGSGGPAPYTYSWNTTPVQNTATASNLCAGTYSVTVTDASGCSTVQSVTVNEPAALSVSTSIVDARCSLPNGEASATGQGGVSPYTYSWSTTPAQTTATATGLSAGQYTVTITDANGCNQSDVAIVSNITTFNTSMQSTDVSCEAENCDGTVSVTPSDGTAPYSYVWSDSLLQTTQMATGLCVGTYTVVITDANGCTATDSVAVNDCPPVIPEFTFYAPNTFTPNGDEKNDLFMGYGTYIQQYDLMIFDRWGEMIFRTNDINKGWDGKANNGLQRAQEDVYIYVVNLTDFYNKKHKFIGHVSLIK